MYSIEDIAFAHYYEANYGSPLWHECWNDPAIRKIWVNLAERMMRYAPLIVNDESLDRIPLREFTAADHIHSVEGVCVKDRYGTCPVGSWQAYLARCPDCGHLWSWHGKSDSRLPEGETVCDKYAGMGDICGCPLVRPE